MSAVMKGEAHKTVLGLVRLCGAETLGGREQSLNTEILLRIGWLEVSWCECW